MPWGSNAAFTRFMRAITSSESSRPMYALLREADAVLAADRPLERHDAFHQRADSLRRARHGLGVGRIHHHVDVDVAVAGVSEARDAQAVFGAEPLDQIDQFRDAAVRHDDVVVQLERRDGAKRVATVSRRTRHSASRSCLASRAQHLERADVAAGCVDRVRLRLDRRRRRRPPQSAGAPRCPRARDARRRTPPRCRASRDPSARASTERHAGPRGRQPPAPRRDTSAKHARSVATAGGFGTSRSVISVTIASVPSDPTSSCVRS